MAPCRDEWADAQDEREARIRGATATRLLCQILAAGYGTHLSPEIEQWWAEHQVIDARRKERELKKIPIHLYDHNG